MKKLSENDHIDFYRHLAFCAVGGFFGCYAVLVHSGVMGNAQTMNLLELVIDLLRWQLPDMLLHLGALALYVLGTMLTVLLPHRWGVDMHRASPLITAAMAVVLFLLPPELDPVVAKRVRHVLTENARTVEAASALEKGDLKRMGELMAESHASMRDDFEITVPQIDTLVEIVKAAIGDKGGVRMTGGGFGGCVVALIPEDLVDTVQQAVANEYEAKTGIKETFYVCKPSQGAGQW